MKHICTTVNSFTHRQYFSNSIPYGPARMEASYLASTAEALNYFRVSEQNGLTDSQVRQFTEKYGRNGILGLVK